MYRFLPIAVLLLSLVTAGADEGGGEADLAAEKIRGVWESRGERLTAARSLWQITARNRSASFGNFDDETANSPEHLLRIAFDERGMSLEGTTIPSVGLAQRTRSAFTGGTGEAAEREEFLAALRDRFSKPQPIEDPLPYRIVRDLSREVHEWDARLPALANGVIDRGGQAPADPRERPGKATHAGASPRVSTSDSTGYPRAIVFAAGTGHRVLGRESLADLPVFSSLLDAFQVAVTPGAAIGEFTVVPKHPVVDGVRCVAVEAVDDEAGEVRQLWLDPTRDFVVVRSLHRIDGAFSGPQYDVEYDQDEAGDWLPASITVTLINSYGDALDSMTVVRRSIERRADSALKNGDSAPASEPVPVFQPPVAIGADGFSWKPRPEMWVDDLQSGEQYYVRPDGSRRPISFNDNYVGLTYADLKDEDLYGTRWYGTGRWRAALHTFVIQGVTWPGILLTLPACYGVVVLTRASLRRFRTRILRHKETILRSSEPPIASLGRSAASTSAAIPAECRSEGPT